MTISEEILRRRRTLFLFLLASTILLSRVLSFSFYLSGEEAIRVTFSPILVIIVSIMFGPLIGSLLGFLKDLIHFAIDYNFVFTDYFISIGIISAIWGFLPYYTYRYFRELLGKTVAIIMTVVLMQFFLSVVAMSLALWWGFGFDFLEILRKRIIVQAIAIPVYSVIAYMAINYVEQEKESINHVKELERLTYIDRLTGAYNRNYVEHILPSLDDYQNLPISVIIADLNGLKLLNDTYGRSIGDKALCCVAEILKRSVRDDSDVVARWGNGEFVILLPNMDRSKVEKLCQDIMKCDISSIANCSDLKIKNEHIVSLSLGHATKSNSDESISNVFIEAENKMHRAKLTESRSARNSIVSAFLETLKTKNFEESHVRRMLPVVELLGRELMLDESDIGNLNLLVNLHDIGKINFRESILTKSGQLTEEEWDEVRRHPEVGYRIAIATEGFSHVALGILHHHERWDGGGYPEGLSGEDIPLLSRIVCIVDSWEVMSGGRAYKKKMGRQQIIEEFENCRGKQFDPIITDVFIGLLEKGLLVNIQPDESKLLDDLGR